MHSNLIDTVAARTLAVLLQVPTSTTASPDDRLVSNSSSASENVEDHAGGEPPPTSDARPPAPANADTAAGNAASSRPSASVAPTAGVAASSLPIGSAATTSSKPPELRPLSGRGVRIAGAAAAIGAVSARVIGLGYGIAEIVADPGPRASSCAWDDVSDECPRRDFMPQIWGFQAVSAMAAGAAIPLLAVGYGRLGQNAAYDEIRHGKVSRRRVRGTLGWSLLGAGAAVFLLTRISFQPGDALWDSHRYYPLQRDLGFFAAMALAVPGAILGGYSSGVALTRRRLRKSIVRVTPSLGGTQAGITVSGRF